MFRWLPAEIIMIQRKVDIAATSETTCELIEKLCSGTGFGLSASVFFEPSVDVHHIITITNFGIRVLHDPSQKYILTAT